MFPYPNTVHFSLNHVTCPSHLILNSFIQTVQIMKLLTCLASWDLISPCQNFGLLNCHSALLNKQISDMLECHLPSIKVWSVWLWISSSGEVQVCFWMFQCGNAAFLTDVVKCLFRKFITLRTEFKQWLLCMWLLTEPLFGWNFVTVDYFWFLLQHSFRRFLAVGVRKRIALL